MNMRALLTNVSVSLLITALAYADNTTTQGRLETMGGSGFDNSYIVFFLASDDEGKYSVYVTLYDSYSQESFYCLGVPPNDPVNVNSTAEYGTASFSGDGLECWSNTGTDFAFSFSAQCNFDGLLQRQEVSNYTETDARTPLPDQNPVTRQGHSNLTNSSATCVLQINDKTINANFSHLFERHEVFIVRQK